MIKTSSIHLNDGTHGLPKNPRFIRDDKFKKLCQSIKDNPEFMPARPIIVDENGVILGGNMRYRACREIGMKELPDNWVQRVEGWPDEKKRRFIILDNRGFGEDDMDMLANEWDIDELVAAGFTECDLGVFPEDANDPEQEWKGEQKFEDEPKCFKTIRVHFLTEKDYIDFLSKTSGKRNSTMCWWSPVDE